MWELINYALALIAIVMLIAVCWISLDKYSGDMDLVQAGNIFCLAAAFASFFISSIVAMYLSNVWS